MERPSASWHKIPVLVALCCAAFHQVSAIAYSMPKTSEQVLESRRGIDVEALTKGEVGNKIADLGKKSLVYSEAKSVLKSKKNKEHMLAAQDVLRSIFAAGCQHITKVQLVQLLTNVLEEHKERIKIKPVHADLWVENVSLRFRNLLHHANGYSKFHENGKSLPVWFAKMKLDGVGNVQPASATIVVPDEPDDDKDDDADDDDDDDDESLLDCSCQDGAEDKPKDKPEDKPEDKPNDKPKDKPKGKSKAQSFAWVYAWNNELNLPERKK